MEERQIREDEVTPELLDRFTVIRATTGDGEYEPLRPDRRLPPLQDSSLPAKGTAPSTLYILVPDYEPATLARLQGLVDESDGRRRRKK